MKKYDTIHAGYWNKKSERLANVNCEMSGLAKREIDDFLNMADLPAGAKILEIGCGAGRFTLPLLRRGYCVVGTDVSEKSLAELAEFAKKENLLSRLELKAMNFTQPVFIDEFDAVLIGNVIHHFDPEKKQQIINNIIQALKPGGKIAVWEPNALCPFYLPWYLFLEFSGKERGIWAAERGIFSSFCSRLKKNFETAGIGELKLVRHTFIPLRMNKIIKSVDKLNEVILQLPLIKHFCAYLWIFGIKK